MILALHPHVAILVPRLPDGNGLDVLTALQAADESLHCLVLDTVPDPQVRRAARDGGARAYLLKEIRGDGLRGALRRAAAGESLFTP